MPSPKPGTMLYLKYPKRWPAILLEIVRTRSRLKVSPSASVKLVLDAKIWHVNLPWFIKKRLSPAQAVLFVDDPSWKVRLAVAWRLKPDELHLLYEDKMIIVLCVAVKRTKDPNAVRGFLDHPSPVVQAAAVAHARYDDVIRLIDSTHACVQEAVVRRLPSTVLTDFRHKLVSLHPEARSVMKSKLGL